MNQNAAHITKAQIVGWISRKENNLKGKRKDARASDIDNQFACMFVGYMANLPQKNHSY